MSRRLILPDERNDDTAVTWWELCAALFCSLALILILALSAMADETRLRAVEIEAEPRLEITDATQRVPTREESAR